MLLRILIRLALALLFAPVAPGPAGAQSDPGPTLAEILKRGRLNCGVVEAPGFAERTADGIWRGFDVDFCRALTAAIFDDPRKVVITPLPAKERLSPLQGGWVDLLVSSAPWKLTRDAGQRVVYAGVALVDGQGFLVRRVRAIASAKDLSGVSVCVQSATSYEIALADFFHARGAPYEPRGFATPETAAAAYEAGQCEALTFDVSTLYGQRAKFANPADHEILPDLLTRAPRGPVVRQGDDQWLSIVRWTLFGMIDAEELGVARETVDAALKSENPDIRWLLGLDGAAGADLGLPNNWAYRMIKHVGNYADVFDRNLGAGSPLGMERRTNALWSHGGLMYAPPVR
jgi:general L-amino acid transport system substrate-binding protein